MWLIKYLWLKSIVSLMRFLTKIKRGTPPVTVNNRIRIISRDRKRAIKVHVYTPSTVKDPVPVLINLHGSGFVLPLHGTDDEFCRRVAEETGYTVFDVQYRLAPEWPFPAANEDVEDVVRYVLNHPDNFARDRIAISGFSAGGNLALVAAGCAFPTGTFRSVLAFYPPTDLSIDPGRKIAPDPTGQSIPAPMARLFDSCYIPPGSRTDDPRISPSFASPESFPDNVFIVTGACDTLAPEADALAEKIAAVAGRHVVHRRYDKCNHAWDKYAVEGSEQHRAKEDSYALALDILRR